MTGMTTVKDLAGHHSHRRLIQTMEEAPKGIRATAQMCTVEIGLRKATMTGRVQVATRQLAAITTIAQTVAQVAMNRADTSKNTLSDRLRVMTTAKVARSNAATDKMTTIKALTIKALLDRVLIARIAIAMSHLRAVMTINATTARTIARKIIALADIAQKTTVQKTTSREAIAAMMPVKAGVLISQTTITAVARLLRLVALRISPKASLRTVLIAGQIIGRGRLQTRRLQITGTTKTSGSS